MNERSVARSLRKKNAVVTPKAGLTAKNQKNKNKQQQQKSNNDASGVQSNGAL